MFTGIVEEVGRVRAINRTQAGILLELQAPTVHSDAKLGDSISVSGVCLSVTDIKKDILGFDVIQETLSRTTLGGLKINDSINLERSLRADSRLGGHFVSGHIDYKGRIIDTLRSQEGIGFKIFLPPEFSKFVAGKGSITVDGVSLTVADLAKESFTVYLIPHTLKNTTFENKKRGDSMNIETDLLAKYLASQSQGPGLKVLLKKYNYI